MFRDERAASGLAGHAISRAAAGLAGERLIVDSTIGLGGLALAGILAFVVGGVGAGGGQCFLHRFFFGRRHVGAADGVGATPGDGQRDGKKEAKKKVITGWVGFATRFMTDPPVWVG